MKGLIYFALVFSLLFVGCPKLSNQIEQVDPLDRKGFFAAVTEGSINRVKAYIDAGVEVSYKREWDGYTALIEASRGGYTDIVKTLLGAGADVNAKTMGDLTALILASRHGYTEIVQALIDKGADVNAQNEIFGITALMSAAGGGHIKIVEALIEAGADLNVQGKMWGATALISAAGGGHMETVKALIEAGADLKVKSKNGYTALGVATYHGHTQIVNLLKAKGAKE